MAPNRKTASMAEHLIDGPAAAESSGLNYGGHVLLRKHALASD
jgi:hypothetical protein